MKAIRIVDLSGPAGVRLVDIDEPDFDDDSVVIDVHVAGVIFPDLLLTRGTYQRRLPLPLIPGGEVAGVVRRAPAGSGLRAGDRVAAMLQRFGGFAETIAVPANFVFPIAESVGFDVAAASPVNYLTMDRALRRRTRLVPGETVLVHGAAGGLGVAAIQLAKAWGAQVIAVASSPEKQDVARAAGAHHVIGVENFLEDTRRIVPGGVDIVVDPVGGDRFTDSTRALADEGRILVLGFASGSIPEVKVNRLLLRNQTVIGVQLGTAVGGDDLELEDGVQEYWADIAALLESGDIAPVISMNVPLSQTGEALAALERRDVIGKIVLQVR